MTGTGTRILLLPEKRRFAGQLPSAQFVRFGRRFSTEEFEPGETAQLKRHFHCRPETDWPVAALCRQNERGDAGAAYWLRADPVYLQVEMRGARVMACDGFDLNESELLAIAETLQPVFSEQGIDFHIGSQGFCYLRIREGKPLPSGTPVMDMLGCDITGHLPSDRRWVALFNECQIVLHNHPLNVIRQRNGQLPVNGMWFWGGGIMPESVGHAFKTVNSDDGIVKALSCQTHAEQGSEDFSLVDLRHSRLWPEIEANFDMHMNTVFDFADGSVWHWRPEWRWHFWKHRSIAFI